MLGGGTHGDKASIDQWSDLKRFAQNAEWDVPEGRVGSVVRQLRFRGEEARRRAVWILRVLVVVVFSGLGFYLGLPFWQEAADWREQTLTQQIEGIDERLAGLQKESDELISKVSEFVADKPKELVSPDGNRMNPVVTFQNDIYFSGATNGGVWVAPSGEASVRVLEAPQGHGYRKPFKTQRGVYFVREDGVVIQVSRSEGESNPRPEAVLEVYGRSLAYPMAIGGSVFVSSSNKDGVWKQGAEERFFKPLVTPDGQALSFSQEINGRVFFISKNKETVWEQVSEGEMVEVAAAVGFDFHGVIDIEGELYVAARRISPAVLPIADQSFKGLHLYSLTTGRIEEVVSVLAGAELEGVEGYNFEIGEDRGAIFLSDGKWFLVPATLFAITRRSSRYSGLNLPLRPLPLIGEIEDVTVGTANDHGFHRKFLTLIEDGELVFLTSERSSGIWVYPSSLPIEASGVGGISELRDFLNTLQSDIKQLPLYQQLLVEVSRMEATVLGLKEVRAETETRRDLFKKLPYAALRASDISLSFERFVNKCRSALPKNNYMASTCIEAWQVHRNGSSQNWWQTLGAQVPPGILLLFLLGTLAALYRYNMRLSGFHHSRADMLELYAAGVVPQHNMDELAKLAAALASDNVAFGKMQVGFGTGSIGIDRSSGK